MNSNQPSSLEESSDNVLPLKRKALDDLVVDFEDWLTPLPDDTKFLVAQYAWDVYAECYTKVCNFEQTVMLIEHFNEYEYSRYVFAKRFCKKYTLVEII